MEIRNLEIDAVKLVSPSYYQDARGHFVETWNSRAFAERGIDVDFVQDNSAYSRVAWTIRGLHFQAPPAGQAKLIRAVCGSILDVAVDLRRASPTFGRYVSAVLTAKGGEQLYIPAEFAHGYCTLEPDTQVAYKVSEFHVAELNAGILWSDPTIGIRWPLEGNHPVLSERDLNLPRLAEIVSPF